ncbi:MAG: MCE family protein [Actinobacteria bacterium]|nr:MCE family protein [Actinomycetota bacterium]
MRGGRAGSLAASPTLVGAVTVLVVVVAVFLAYQANQGLPFVPTYKLSAQVPNANTLVPGNEVRVGGIRVGAVKAVEPVQNEDGSVNAKLDLELNQDVDPLPVDSTVIVRSRSALGLKYLELVRGTSEEGFEPGATMPLSAATPAPVEIDQVFNTFDDPTRAAIQANLTEFGNALAGRGQALNAAIGDLAPLVERLEPVMRNLASSDTDLGGFVRGLSAAAAEAAPVAAVQGQLFVDLETTFGAFANVARPYIQETISRSPETEDTAIRTLPVIRPLLKNTAGLFSDLRPGFAAFRPVSYDAMRAIKVGVKALRLAPGFNAQLAPTVQALLNLNNNAPAREGIDDLDAFFTQAQPLLAHVGPAQSVCNYATLLFRNVANHLAFGDGAGTWQRFIVLEPPTGLNNEGSPSSGPANGGGSSTPNNFLHSNFYPNTASAGQSPIECEAANEPYLAGRQVIGNVPGNQGIVTEGQTDEQLGIGKKKKKKKK